MSISEYFLPRPSLIIKKINQDLNGTRDSVNVNNEEVWWAATDLHKQSGQVKRETGISLHVSLKPGRGVYSSIKSNN